MSTDKKQDAVNKAATKATPNRLKVADELADAYKALDDQRSIVTQVCNKAMAVFKGSEIGT